MCPTGTGIYTCRAPHVYGNAVHLPLMSRSMKRTVAYSDSPESYLKVIIDEVVQIDRSTASVAVDGTAGDMVTRPHI